ncbi:MAG: hypothetical protein HUU16_11815 [Candidatus Omnitrophica bacterium]|nr:hypothetical protein [Candidatus Omnitrophota bacterium]
MRTKRFLISLTVGLLLGGGAALAQWQKIGKEQLPANLGDINAGFLSASKLKVLDGAGSNHYLYVGNDSGTSTEGFRLRNDSSSGQSYLYVRNSLKFQFDASSIYARDPLDFFDGDSLSWSSDDGSLGYNAGTNQFRFEDSSDVTKVSFDMDDGSGDFEGRLAVGGTSAPLVLFVGASSYNAGGTDWRWDSTGDYIEATLTGDNDCSFPIPHLSGGTTIASVRVFCFLSSDADTLSASLRKRTHDADGSPSAPTSTTLQSSGALARASMTAQTGSNYYFDLTGGSLPYTLTGAAGNLDELKLELSGNLDSVSNDLRVYGFAVTYREVTH